MSFRNKTLLAIIATFFILVMPTYAQQGPQTFYLKNGHRREVNFKHIFTDRDIEGVGKFPASEKSFHHGKSCEWDSEGQIISERNYLDGKADGASIQWHSNSQMSWKIYMKQGKFHGKSVTWDINGQKKDEGIYNIKKGIGVGNLSRYTCIRSNLCP